MTTNDLKAEQGQAAPAPPPIRRSEAGILEELRQSERRFRAVQETSPDGFMLFDSVRDEKGTIIDFEWLYANPASEAVIGRAGASLLGKRLLGEMPGNLESGLFERYLRVVETGVTEQWEHQYEHEGLDYWFRNTAAKVGDGFAVSFADITAQKRSEAALWAREEEFRTMADSIPQLVWMADESGYIFWYNRRWYEYTGTQPEDMEGWGWQSVHDSTELPRVLERWQTSLGTGEPFDMVFPIRNAEGVFRPFLTRVVPIRDTVGSITRWLGTNTDITEQREAAQRQQFLAEASALLASTLDYRTTLDEVSRLAVPELADWCAVDVLDDEGQIQRVAVAHPDPAQEEIARELQRRYPPDPDATRGVPQVLRSGEPELVPEIPPGLIEQAAVDEEHLRLLRALDLRSYLIVPLAARGRRLGALTLVHAESARCFSEEDLRFATALAQRAAIAVDNALLFQQASEARRQTEIILESITDAFFALDGDWNFTYVNREAERLFRHQGEVLLGQSIWDVFPDARNSVFWDEYHRALQEQVAVRFETRDLETGTWYDFHAYPSADGLAVYFRDISREKQADLEMRASQERYRFLANAIPQQVWTAGPDGQLDYVNRVVTEFFGRTAGEVIGDGWQAVVHPEDLSRVVTRWIASVRTGNPYEVEFRLRRSDGEYRWHIGRAVALQDPSGSVQRWFGTNTDVDEQKRGEAERERLLAEAAAERARLRELIENAPAVMALYHGPEHVISTVNPAWQRIVGKPNAVGRPFREVFPEFEGSGLFEQLDRVYETGEPFADAEANVPLDRHDTGNLEDTYWNLVWQPLKNVAGDTEDILVHAVEVTAQVLARRAIEEKAAELEHLTAALAASNRELDQFAYVASHDLKAPLRGIANLSQWIEEDLGTEVPEEVAGHLDLLRGRVHRMEGLIDGILEFSRAGRSADAAEAVSVDELLAEVIDLLSPPDDTTIEIPPGLPTLRTERLPLQQVFMNLLGNAIKYGRPGQGPQHIAIGAGGQGSFHEFSVSDNGPGIAPEYHDRIFAIFQRLDARDTVEGTGIGLSLVKKLVESRGGRVWVESQPGSGSTFFFTWPKTAGTPPQSA